MSSRRGFVTAAVAVAAACAAPVRAADALRVGVVPTDGFAAADYALELGYFARAGIDADVALFSNGSAISAALGGGALDIGISNVVSIANAVIRGIPFAFFAGGNIYDVNAPTVALCVAKDATIRAVREFEHGTIAVAALRDGTHLAALAYLRGAGIDVATINFVEMPFPAMSAALKRGTVLGAIISEPFLTLGGDETRPFAKPYEVFGDRYMVGGWFGASEWLAQHAPLARRFTAAIYDAGRWANANHERSAAILAKYAKIDEAVARRMMRATYADRLLPEMLDSTLRIAAAEKFTNRRVAPAEMIVRP